MKDLFSKILTRRSRTCLKIGFFFSNWHLFFSFSVQTVIKEGRDLVEVNPFSEDKIDHVVGCVVKRVRETWKYRNEDKKKLEPGQINENPRGPKLSLAEELREDPYVEG